MSLLLLPLGVGSGKIGVVLILGLLNKVVYVNNRARYEKMINLK